MIGTLRGREGHAAGLPTIKFKFKFTVRLDENISTSKELVSYFHFDTLPKNLAIRLAIRFYIYKRPGRASQNSSLIISQCINSILDRTDFLDLLLFFFPFDFVGFVFCVFSSVCDCGVSLSANSLVMDSDEVEVDGSVSG